MLDSLMAGNPVGTPSRRGQNGGMEPDRVAEAVVAQTVDRVLLAADLVPAGRVVSYGDIAELVGTSARRVGRIMAEHGHDVCWWRVVNASGDLPAGLRASARRQWEAEGTPVKASGAGCRIGACRADPMAWAAAYCRESRDPTSP